MRVLKFTVLYLVMVLSLLFSNAVFSVVAEEDAPSESFDWYTDVDARNTYHDAIYYMTQSGYVEGYEDGTFLPFQEVTRAEALKIILSVSQVGNDPNADEMNFPDVDTDDWFFDYAKEGYAKNIMQGHEDGYFRPGEPVNRAEAMKMLSNSQGMMYTDELMENWYDHYMGYAAESALLVPVEGENGEWDYLPSANLTRGELCEIIYRLMKDKYTGELEYGVATYYGYSFNGANTASGTPLDAYGYMAAHKTLPFGTWVRVTNLDTMLSVDVEIVDRGPYGEGRVIDLTPHAFDQIGSLSTGVLRTRVEVLK